MSHILLSGLTARKRRPTAYASVSRYFRRAYAGFIGVVWGASARSRGGGAGGWVRVWRGRERRADGTTTRLANSEKILGGRGGVKLG